MDSELDMKLQYKRAANFGLCVQRDHITELGTSNTYIYEPDMDTSLVLGTALHQRYWEIGENSKKKKSNWEAGGI